jgi:uncharacterized protein YeeX (DUF496 family)
VYEEFGFENKELVWEYIGGKIGDMVRLFERKKLGYSEREAVERMLRDEVARLELLLRTFKYSPLKVTMRERIIELKAKEFIEGF